MQNISSRIAFLVGLAALSTGFAEDDVKSEDTKIGAWIDVGQIWEGKLDRDEEIEKQMVTRSKVSLTQVATINERLVLTGAVGGLFYYSLPVLAGGPHTRMTKFSAVLEEASGKYTFGDLDNPFVESKFGLFFEKQNSDSKNLGEYLFRSGTYPGYLVTGGWYILNNSGYFMQGVKTTVNLLDQKLKVSGAVYMDRDWEPTYDFNPALMVNYKPSEVFELGGGVVFSHLIPVKGSLTTPVDKQATWYTTPTGKDTLMNQDELIDTIPRALKHYSFQGTKLDFRGSFNPQAIIQSDMLNPEDLKIYAEVAVLGVKNYPIYYPKIQKRMPMMLGFNIPTFKILDMASIELEYYDNDYPNSIEEVYERALPVPGGIGAIGTKKRQDYIDSASTQRKLGEKVKWSLLLNKKMGRGLSIYCQVASDHFRTLDYNLKQTYEPVLRDWSQWYYMFRLNFGI
jgi:hypothetical protein